MASNVTKWEWTLERRRAAVRLADGRMTDDEIAAEAGISDRQFQRWKKLPQFAARVSSIMERQGAAIEDIAIADKRQRMIVLQDLFERQYGIIVERAVKGQMQADEQDARPHLGGDILNRVGKERYHPGARYGLVASQVKQIGTMLAEEAAADTGLVKSILATMEQAAKESGQWETKIGVNHSGRVTHDHRHFDLSNLTDDELNQLEQLAEKVELGMVTG